MMRICAGLSALLVALFLVGCDGDEDGGKSNFSHLAYYKEPEVQVSRDPQADFKAYHTAAIVPTGEEISPVAMKQIVYSMRANLELNGFTIEDSPEKADLLLCVYANSEQRETYIPPKTVPFPVFSPSRRVTQTERWTGTVGNVPFGASGRSETRERARTEYVPVTVPERTELHWWPYLSVMALDGPRARSVASTEKPDSKALLETAVWEGTAFGCTDVADAALAVQGLVRRLAQRFPPNGPTVGANMGMLLFIASTDGQAFYPAVLGLTKGGPAGRAGIRTDDLITAIDGKSTAQLSGAQVRLLLEGNRGMVRQVTVKRLEATLTVTLRP
jgi:hypothetical protein